jgi:hypothetical protein
MLERQMLKLSISESTRPIFKRDVYYANLTVLSWATVVVGTRERI